MKYFLLFVLQMIDLCVTPLSQTALQKVGQEAWPLLMHLNIIMDLWTDLLSYNRT